MVVYAKIIFKINLITNLVFSLCYKYSELISVKIDCLLYSYIVKSFGFVKNYFCIGLSFYVVEYI